MSNYEKPMVVVADETAEGVFLGSGSVADNGSGTKPTFTYTISGGPWDGQTQYAFSATNNGEAVDNMIITVGLSGDVNSIGSDTNVSAQINGSSAVLTIGKYNGKVEAGETVTGHIYVYGTGQVGLA